MTTTILILMTLLLVASALAGYRVLVGPSLADRVLALEVSATMLVGLLAVAAMRFDAAVLLDIAMVLAVAGFIGTVAFARFLERRALEAPPDEAATAMPSDPPAEGGPA